MISNPFRYFLIISFIQELLSTCVVENTVLSMDGIPESIADQIPALAPPPGTVPNFVNPPSEAGTMLAYATVMVMPFNLDAEARLTNNRFQSPL